MLAISHIVEEIHMVAIGGQRDGNTCLPGFHQSPNDLVGIIALRNILAVCSQFQLHILVCAICRPVIVVAVDIKCDGTASGQGLAEVQPETGPAMACVAYLQGIAAAVCRRSHIGIGIGYSLDGNILRYARTGKVQFVALVLKVQADQNIACGFRFLSRFNRLEVIHIDLKICRTGLIPTIHIAHQINILPIFSQHDLQISPAIVVVLIRCSIVSGINQIGFAGNALKNRNRILFRIGSILAVCLEADHSTGLQGLAEVYTEDRPLAACAGDLQGIIAIKRNAFKGCISPGVFAAYRTKPQFIAGGLKIDSLQEVAGGFNGLDGDHIVNVYGAGGTGNNTRTVVVPEQIHIGCSLRQGDRQLCPLITLELLCSLSAAGKFKDALIILGLALDGTVRHKGDLGTCRQSLAEVHSEGGPIEALMAQLH